MHLIDLYNFKPPADLIVHREESQAIRINAAKTSLVRAAGGADKTMIVVWTTVVLCPFNLKHQQLLDVI